MLNQPKRPIASNRSPIQLTLLCVVGLAACALGGCQDGPLYAIKAVNPYYTMGEWKRDEAIGVTDHERRIQLISLAETIDQLPAERQKYWAEHFDKILENDESPEMRRLVMLAAGRSNDPSSLDLIERGLDDASMKVRMEACNSLGRRQEEQSAKMLATVVGTETDQNVKHAALRALANHKSQIAINSLKIALADRDPATRHLAVQSLKGSTNQDYGDDPRVWIAALEGKPPQQQEAPTKIADRIRSVF
jgi:hypothetical protein